MCENSLKELVNDHDHIEIALLIDMSLKEILTFLAQDLLINAQMAVPRSIINCFYLQKLA